MLKLQKSINSTKTSKITNDKKKCMRNYHETSCLETEQYRSNNFAKISFPRNSIEDLKQTERKIMPFFLTLSKLMYEIVRTVDYDKVSYYNKLRSLL